MFYDKTWFKFVSPTGGLLPPAVIIFCLRIYMNNFYIPAIIWNACTSIICFYACSWWRYLCPWEWFFMETHSGLWLIPRIRGQLYGVLVHYLLLVWINCWTNSWVRLWYWTPWRSCGVMYASVNLSSSNHYSDVIVSAMVYQIAGVSIVCSTVCSGTYQRNHQSSATLAFRRGSTGDRWIPLTEGQ